MKLTLYIFLVLLLNLVDAEATNSTDGVKPAVKYYIFREDCYTKFVDK